LLATPLFTLLSSYSTSFFLPHPHHSAGLNFQQQNRDHEPHYTRCSASLFLFVAVSSTTSNNLKKAKATKNQKNKLFKKKKNTRDRKGVG